MAATNDLDLLVGLSPTQESINSLADAIASAFAKGSAKGVKHAIDSLRTVIPQLGEKSSAIEARALAENAIGALTALGSTKKAKSDPALSAYISAAKELMRGSVLGPATSLIRATTPARLAAVPPSASAARRVATQKAQAEGLIYLPGEGGSVGTTAESVAASASETAYNEAEKRFNEFAKKYSEAETEENKRVYKRILSRQASVLRANMTPENEEQTERLIDAILGNTEAQHDNSAVIKTIGTTVVTAGLQFASAYFPSKWGQSLSRNQIASEQAYRERITTGGQGLGNVAGSVLGAVIGGAITGGMGGQIVGAQIGGNVGGAVGGLFGKYKETELERYRKSQAYALGMYKDFYTFKGTGYNLGAAMEEAGVASAASLNNMRWSGQTLAGGFALGMIGEQDMLMLSLMPEYFAALMSGADGATLAAAYKRSIDNLPPQLRAVVATNVAGGSQEMYAASQLPTFDKALANASSYALRDTVGAAVGEGYSAQAINAAQATRTRAFTEMARDTFELAQDTQNLFYTSGNNALQLMQGYGGKTYADIAKMYESFGKTMDLDNYTESWRDIGRKLDQLLETGIHVNITVDEEGVSATAPQQSAPYTIVF